MDQKAVRLRNILTILLILLVLLSGVFLLQGYLEGRFDSAESLQQYIGSFGPLGPLVLVVVQAIQVIVPVLPGFLGCAVGAAMFGPWGGFWCNYIGISAGSIISFLLARRFGVELVRHMVPEKKYQTWTTWVNSKKSYTIVLFLAILLPLAPDDILCYFSGLTGMPVKRFTWIILLGKPWCIFAYSLFFGDFI